MDNDDTASRVLDVMNRERSGRVTFMPLNRLKSVAVQYPKADDALPMISKLRFDRAYIMAFEQVNEFPKDRRRLLKSVRFSVAQSYATILPLLLSTLEVMD